MALAVILGIGGFLWQSSLYHEKLDRIDTELQMTAGTLDYLQQTLSTEEETTAVSCELVTAPLQLLLDEWHFARYSPNGDLICMSTSGIHSQVAMPDWRQTDNKTLFFSVSKGNTRRALAWPTKDSDKITAYQLLSTDLGTFSAQLLRWRLALLLGSLLIMAAAASYFLHLQRNHKTKDLKRLLKYIDDIRPDQPPQPLATDQFNSRELRQLAESCYRLSERMFSALHRARQFATHVAHELRTPLTILRGETEIALRCKSETAEIRQLLESNLEEITRMSFLVDDLLTLSKSDLGEIPLQPTTIDLHRLLNDLQRQGEILAGEKGILLELDCPDDGAVIHADELRVRQALLNLLTNAIRYTPPQGVVTIAAGVTESAVTITISDTGIGIEDRHLQHIFERFYRVDKKIHQYDGGTGLGLAIVKWVVDAHHGTISVSSIPGQGSSFTMTLPKNQNNCSRG
jgi:signal transduction histidine kinase